MKKKTLLPVLLLSTAACLASCAKGDPALTDYVNELDVFASKEEATILQITDLHWSYGTDYKKQYDYLEALISSSSPDLIVTTGDNVLMANKTTVQAVISALDELCEKYHCKFAINFGNHDQQGIYDPYYWGRELKKAKNSLYIELEDNVYGEANYVINLTDGNKTIFQVYQIDSNSLIQKDSFSFLYDRIHDDQIAWFEKEADLAKENNGGAYVPNLVYFHIGLWETEYAYRLASRAPFNGSLETFNGREGYEDVPGTLYKSSGFEKESSTYEMEDLGETKTWVAYENSGMFVSAEKHGTVGMFFGHDHTNSYCAQYASKDSSRTADNAITIGYGLKTGQGLYYDAEMIGGNLTKIKKDGSYSFYRAFQTYQDDYSDHAGYQERGLFE